MMNSGLLTDATRAVDYKQLKVSSTAFPNGGLISVKYSCDGRNINPPFNIKYIPEEANCLPLIVDDPDAWQVAGLTGWHGTLSIKKIVTDETSPKN